MNNDLISRSAAKDEILSWAAVINKPHLLSKDDTLHVLDTLPAVNAVEVDDNLGEMLNWAVRYALGRMTYAVNDTVSYVLPLIPKLDRKTLSVMQRDIERAPEYGHDCDEADWMRLLYAIREERKRRENHDE